MPAQVKFTSFVMQESMEWSVFSEESKHVQGPSLTVFNNKNFEQRDYEGFQNLGIGSKETMKTQLENLTLVSTLFILSLTLQCSFQMTILLFLIRTDTL